MEYILYLLCFLLSWTVVHHFLSQLLRSKRNLPPGPTPLPIIGNLLSLGNKPHIALSRLAQTYGPVMYLKLGSLETVVISSPESAKEVMQKHDISFSHRTVPDALRACSHIDFSITFLPPHAPWRNLRKIVNSQIFSSSRLDASSHLRKEKVNDLLAQIDASARAGVAVNIGQAVFDTTLNLLSNTFSSVNLTDQPLGSIASLAEFKCVVSIEIEAGAPNLSDYFPLLRWLDPQGIRKGMKVHLSKVLNLFDDMIDKRLEASATGEKVNGESTNGDTLAALLEMITDQDDNDEAAFNRDYLRHLLLVLFVAGTDTTSSTFEWVMTELLRNPTKMKKVQEELDEVIGKGNSVDEIYLSKLPYLQAVLKETFRLHPPVPFLVPRKAAINIDLNGYIVPKDSQVLINVWAIGRDPNLWEDVKSFEPERFIDSKIDVKGLNFELTPFGAGRRMCPGMPLVVRMLPLMLASMLHLFDWKLEDKTTIASLDMEENFGLTLQKAKPLIAIPIRKL